MRVTWPDGSVSGVHASAPALNAALARLVAHAERDLRRCPRDLYGDARRGLVRYQRERRREREQWQSPSQTRARGVADCEDLAAERAAALRIGGEDARAVARHIRGAQWHAVVRRASGRLEDPTRILKDMGAELGAEEGARVMPRGATVEWEAQPSERVRGGWRGVVRVRMADGGVHVVQRGGATRQQALARGVRAAGRLLDSPLARSLLPPQAALALQLLRSRQAQAIARGASRLFRSIF